MRTIASRGGREPSETRPEGEEITDTRTTGQEFQAEVLGAVRKTEEMLADAITFWAGAVQSITPSIPMPSLPYSGKLPKPEELMASAYDFAEQMLIAQRKFADSLLEAARSQRKFAESLLGATRSQQKFAEGLIEATKPLLAVGNGATAKRGATK
jgi:hypothetical protein